MASIRRLFSQTPPKAWGAEFVRARQLSSPFDNPRLSGATKRQAWRRVTVKTALGVPAIQRAVALIASTTGMLSVEAYRNGVLMADPPRLIVRPDPYQTPGAFYAGSAANMAKYGEIVWWIASVDTDGQASALINVPLNELRVQENPANRLFPTYRWGSETGTRYSGGNPSGRFVHIKYPLAEPYALRGEGPLQLCGAANSVAVESQEWAANFYGEGGQPAALIKKVGSLSPVKLDPLTWLPMDPADPEYDSRGRSEGDLIRDQIIGRANNTSMVIDDSIESVEYKDVAQGGAQMLEGRGFNNGEASRQFGIPGPLLEYQQPGGSLTYQNRIELKGALLEMCLMPLYLEPMEQALSDLLTRSTIAKFSVAGFLRADIKTRYEVHALAIANKVYDGAYARREEGIDPGDVEFAPVPFAQPAALPSKVPGLPSASLSKALTLDWRCQSCNAKLLEQAGPGTIATCRRCKSRNEMPLVELSAELPSEGRIEIHNHFPADFVRVDSPVTVNPADVHLEPVFHNHFPEGMVQIDAPVTVHPTDVHVEPTFNAAPLPVATEGEQALASEVDGMRAAIRALGEPPVINVEAPIVNVQTDSFATAVEDFKALLAAPRNKRIERDEQGRITGLVDA